MIPSGTLRRDLLLRLFAPLLIIILIGAGLSLAAARHFAGQVYDQWLYDSAMTLGVQVKDGPDGPTVALPKSAVEMLEWDRVDRVFYEVTDGGHVIFGNAELPSPPYIGRQPVFYDGAIKGVRIRLSAVGIPVGQRTVTVIFGETLGKRTAIVSSIMTAILPIETILLALTGILVWVGVTSALHRVNGLAMELIRVDPETLQPLDNTLGLPTEIRPVVDALNDLIGRLAEARDAARRFVANAAHQLRTPLAAMQIQTQRALRETDPGRHHDALIAVEKAVLRLSHLTQQLLALARAEPGSTPRVLQQKIDLAALAKQELEQWADAAIARGIDLGYAGPERGPWVVGEPQLLTDLIDNLVDNAIRYAGDHARVTLRLEEDPATLIVEDNGPGIPPEQRSRVLERFYRLPTAPSGGTGLGLAIASEIVKRHDATLRISGGPDGRGTVVTVHFARATASEAPPAMDEPSPQRFAAQ